MSTTVAPRGLFAPEVPLLSGSPAVPFLRLVVGPRDEDISIRLEGVLVVPKHVALAVGRIRARGVQRYVFRGLGVSGINLPRARAEDPVAVVHDSVVVSADEVHADDSSR